ncbi:hypothetical protein KCV87_00545 [Actinosynnema pretiosum subsp. pretiosum]|uniref:Uncharacterized protein n=1 Tax=Actinosynnema pretiosum subsp. pretiosum TaxID=103721 RepID=A0AA45L7N5_9PSEU|nr:hypothetical protein APASM_3900 [Actinosynnema pretiosum subsp. pretiosum]QUF04670.1 hypothetical protein KCV87_00545 [Actinosynnema pretiosum subsp. pretiosum]
MLLERLDCTRTLATVKDDDKAMRTIAALLDQLTSTPASDTIPTLHDIATKMVAQTPTAAGNRLLHRDLHFDNVLAGERHPWPAIDPVPLAGDPGFDLWPALDGNWNARAAAWTLGRVLQNCLWDVEDGRTTLAPPQLTVAHAVTQGGPTPPPPAPTLVQRDGEERTLSDLRRVSESDEP